MPILKNVHLYYVKIKTPALEYQKEAVPDEPHMNRECVIDVLLSEDDYKELKKRYRSVKSVKDAKEYDAEEFEEKFKVAPPFESDSYYIVKFKKRCYYINDGKPAQKPEVVGIIGKVQDLEGNVVNADVNIGNGSVGHVQFKERPWDNKFGKGLALDLYAICIKNLVEYSSDGLEFDFEEVDEEELDSNFGSDEEGFEGIEEEETKPKPKAKTSTKKAQDPEPEDEDW